MGILKKLFNKASSVDNRFTNKGLFNEFQNVEPTVEDFTKLIEREPAQPINYIGRGRAYGRICQYEHAINDFSHALSMIDGNAKNLDMELSVDPATIYINRGLAYWAYKDYKNSIRDFTNAIELEPDNAPLYNNRGWHFEVLGEHQLAINDFDEAIRLKPDFAEAYNLRGGCYEALEDYEQMCRDFKKAVEFGGDPIALKSARKAGICL